MSVTIGGEMRWLRLIMLSLAVPVISCAGGALVGFGVVTLYSEMSTLPWTDENIHDLRNTGAAPAVALGGFAGILLAGGLWANVLFGWEPSWDRGHRRGR
ncbi:MAG: hypothetical protein ACXWH0_14810 [Acidimicrobiia bacterium]